MDKKKPSTSKSKNTSGGRVPPKCQVEGCGAVLTDTKPFYWRHKVCPQHSKSPKVIIAGVEMRFCQQCSRFHELAEFDKENRSCCRRLAGHNQRRRKVPPGGAMVPPMFGNLLGGSGSFMMDFGAYATSQEHNAQLLFPWQNSPQAQNSFSQFQFPEECRPPVASSLLSDHQHWNPQTEPPGGGTPLPDHFDIFSPWSNNQELLQPDLGLGLPQHTGDDYFGVLGLGLPSHDDDHSSSSYSSVHHFQHWAPM